MSDGPTTQALIDRQDLLWEDAQRCFRAVIGEIEAAGDVQKKTGWMRHAWHRRLTWIRWLKALHRYCENQHTMAVAHIVAERAAADALRSLPPEALAHRFFACVGIEFDLDNALMIAMGATADADGETDPESWPCRHIVYDDYDGSFELWNVKADDWQPTPAHLASAWALGFARGWICYPDGTERYYSSKGEQSGRKRSPLPRESDEKYRLAKLTVRTEAAEAEVARLTPPPAPLKKYQMAFGLDPADHDEENLHCFHPLRHVYLAAEVDALVARLTQARDPRELTSEMREYIAAFLLLHPAESLTYDDVFAMVTQVLNWGPLPSPQEAR